MAAASESNPVALGGRELQAAPEYSPVKEYNRQGRPLLHGC